MLQILEKLCRNAPELFGRETVRRNILRALEQLVLLLKSSKVIIFCVYLQEQANFIYLSGRPKWAVKLRDQHRYNLQWHK